MVAIGKPIHNLKPRPTMKLKEKQRIGGRYRKTYTQPETPYARVMASKSVTKAAKVTLKAQHDSLNPFELKATIEAKLKRIFNNVTVTSKVRQRI